jgi:hypothetical protein
MEPVWFTDFYWGGSASNSIETESDIAVDNEEMYMSQETQILEISSTSGAYQPNNNGGFQGDVS